MARNCYPELKLGGYTPTAYWDFCSAADTAGQGRGYTPVAWEHLTGADLDTSSAVDCIIPAMYYQRSPNLTSELSKQAANIYTSSSATWLVQFRTDGATVGDDCFLQYSTPGGAGNSKLGFVMLASTNAISVHMKGNIENAVAQSVAISGGTADKTFCAALSFNTSSYRISANGMSSSEGTTPSGFSITTTEPVVLGHYWDSFWSSLKGWVMRVATWQDYVASASEMDVLTAAFADPCYASLTTPANAIMFSCNT